MNQLPKYLYHGTSAKFLDEIIANGLQPRGNTVGNWDSCPSHPDAIYLTSAFAVYYAYAAASNTDDNMLVLRIDTSKLEYNKFYADEDAIEQALRGQDDIKLSMEDRVIFYRDNIKNYPAEPSLKLLGNCTYMGAIPPEAIDTYKVLDSTKYIHLITGGYDPTITIMCYKFLKDRYNILCNSLFNGWNDNITISKEQFQSLFIKEI